MRQIGILQNLPEATRFADFLLTQGIKSQVDQTEAGCEVWVYDEDRIAEAASSWNRFSADPGTPEFQEAERAARQLRGELAQRERQSRGKVVDVRRQWVSPGVAGRLVTWIMLGFSVVVGVKTKFGDKNLVDPVVQALSINEYGESKTHPGYVQWDQPLSPDANWRRGQVWRLVTPIFLHFGPLHLLFNAMWLHSLGGIIETRRGSWRFLLLVLWIAVTSNVAQFVWDGPTFGGLSGVVFGLFGYLWMKSRYDPWSGMRIDPQSVTMMLFWLVLCMTGMVGRIANAAHLVGLIAGILAGLAPLAIRRLRSR
ncbi:MAG: rhomboid family intramembrane serine protease [Planctomycetales bacterium]